MKTPAGLPFIAPFEKKLLIVVSVVALAIGGAVLHQKYYPETPVAKAEVNEKAATAAKSIILLAGYKCDQVDFLSQADYRGKEFNVRCGKYRYEIKDHGGNAVVTVRD